MATASMLRALRAIAECGAPRLHIGEFYRAMAVSNRGRYLVMNRMLEAGLIERHAYAGSTHLTITEDGHAALARKEP